MFLSWREWATERLALTGVSAADRRLQRLPLGVRQRRARVLPRTGPSLPRSSLQPSPPRTMGHRGPKPTPLNSTRTMGSIGAHAYSAAIADSGMTVHSPDTSSQTPGQVSALHLPVQGFRRHDEVSSTLPRGLAPAPSVLTNEASGHRGRASPSGRAGGHRRQASTCVVLPGRAPDVPCASGCSGHPRSATVAPDAR